MKALEQPSQWISYKSDIQKHTIERVTFGGGGARGSAYSGVYRALVRTGVYQYINEISGNSAGAINAAFLACGMSTTAFRNALLTTNFPDLLGRHVGQIFQKNRQGVSFIARDGKPLETEIRNMIIQSIRDSIKKLPENHKDEDLGMIIDKIQNENPFITFGDLGILNHYYPDTFKKLSLPAVECPNGKIHIFNCTLTPDVEIARACRASASIPVILEPVNIAIQGKTYQFIDGAYFDDLPTDYYDLDEEQHFIANTKPLQTLVFAFSEGLNNQSNQIFQALYGSRNDESISDEILMPFLHKIVPYFQQQMPVDEILDLVKNKLKAKINKQKINEAQAEIIFNETKKFILHLKKNMEKYQNLETKGLIDSCRQFIIKNLKPTLFNVVFIERLKDELLEFFADMRASYKHTTQKEVGYQKIRSFYPLRTVELRIGELELTDFHKAARCAKTLDALGYLDTVSYLCNHELHDPEVFHAQGFHTEFMGHFQPIYNAILLGAGKNPKHDALNQQIYSLRIELRAKRESITTQEINTQIYQLIKEKVEQNLDSLEAFALTRAVEFQNNIITAEELFKETYEESFKRSAFFSRSKVSGQTIFSNNTLHQSLHNKNMFDLHNNQMINKQNTRTNIVFNALMNIEPFQLEYENWSEKHCESTSFTPPITAKL